MKHYIFLALILCPTLLHSQQFSGNKKDIAKILEKSAAFSTYYTSSDFDKMAACYTADATLLADREKIINGQKAIGAWWVMPEGARVSKHKATPEEIQVIKKYAYDYGYYEGETTKEDGTAIPWNGKYVIVWKKVGKDWLIHLDIWNRVN